jgi:hypothetical protein
MDVMPNTLLVKTVSEFYDEAEIWAAKEMVYGQLNPNSRNIKHRGADRNLQNVTDILDVLHKADPEDIPMFGVFDLGRLPPLDMNTVDVTSMYHDIKKLKDALSENSLVTNMATQMDLIRQQMSSMKSNMEVIGAQLSQVVQDVSTKPKPNLLQPSFSAADPTKFPLLGNIDSTCTEERKSLAATDARQPAASASNPVNLFSESPKVQRHKRVRPNPGGQPFYSQIASTLGPASNPVESNGRKSDAQTTQQQEDNEGFRQVLKKRNRIRNTMVVGTSSSGHGDLKSRGRYVSLFISRLDPDCDSVELEKYIKGKFEIDLSCTKLDTRYDTYASFKAEGYCKNPAMFYDANMWPESILVRRYFKPRE